MAIPDTHPEDEGTSPDVETFSEETEESLIESESDAAGATAQPSSDREGTPPNRIEDRTEERKALRVKAVVQFRESDEDKRTEVVEVTTISKNGAALMLSHPCPVGRLVSIALQMPQDMRLYDLDHDAYTTMGVVQNCYTTSAEDEPVYQVGVAFIGKKVPESYISNPKQCYRITGRSEEGLWNVAEAARDFKTRKYARFWRRLGVVISLRDAAKQKTHRQTVYTRDVSTGGMSVWGPLNASIGDRVKITSKEFDFYSMALVRNRTESDDDEKKSLIHFEFDGAEFPVSKIHLPPPPDADEVTATDAALADISDQLEEPSGDAETVAEADNDDDTDDTEVVRY